ncbi:hypothetical protein AGDE_14387 [Angomonas deanei]|uniref:Uncharacterized protein n=1 Tax=Angomonas deanei TaxID=59799 RepID=A0A7G2CJ80_9TRYP|nr:hypothetical protein AGDE_14387 [Angomonas deanei]CAD2219836.1 hypothetical protein, conserved [Angomonas deanei]|eukprot:EPY20934.1 hypothetical protein AGDE_14387 [Angomonas deanei]
MVDRGAPYVDEVLCNLDKGNTPDVGAVIGLYYLNDANQNLIVSVLDTGVVHFYSFIKNIFVGRSRLFKEHTCLLKKVIFSSDSLLICGDSLGVVRIYDLQKFISAQVAGAERRASTAMDVSAASMGSSMVGSEFMTRFSKKERIPLLYVYQGASEEICSLAVYHCSSRSTAGMFIDLNDYTMPTMNAPAPAGILSSKLAGSPTSAVSPTAPTGLLTSSLTSPKTATTAGGSSTTTNHSNNNGSHASRDYFIICGSIDGNVRIHRLYPFNDKQRVSSADKRTEFGQVRTLGLFGVDTWELSDEQTFSDTIVPAQEEARLVAQRQNELLSTLVRQARRLSQPSSTSGEGTPTVAESTLKGTVRTQEATMRSTTKKPLKSTSTSEKTEEPALDETQAQQPFTAPHTLHSLLPVKEVATPLPLQSAKGAGTTVHRKPLEQSKYTRNPLVKSYPMRWLRKIGVAQQVRAEDDDDGDVLVPSDIAFSPESYERLNPFQREIPETSSESSTSALGGPALRRETRRPGRDSTTTFLTAVENMEDYPIASSALRRRSTRQSSASDGGSAGSSRHASVVSVDRRPTMQEQPHSAPPCCGGGGGGHQLPAVPHPRGAAGSAHAVAPRQAAGPIETKGKLQHAAAAPLAGAGGGARDRGGDTGGRPAPTWCEAAGGGTLHL